MTFLLEVAQRLALERHERASYLLARLGFGLATVDRVGGLCDTGPPSASDSTVSASPASRRPTASVSALRSRVPTLRSR